MADTTSENKVMPFAAIAIAVWTVVLIVAFLANRGSDIGQIDTLFAGLGGGPLLGSGFTGSLIGISIAAAIAITWYGVGNLIVSQILTTKSGDGPSLLLDFSMKAAAGAAVWSVVWFFLGLAGLYTRPVAFVALLIGVGLAACGFRGFRGTAIGDEDNTRSSAFNSLVLGLIAIPPVLSFIASLAPPIAKDTLLYHFAVPKAFVEQGGNGFIQGNIASYLALGTEMHFVWGMLLAGVSNISIAEAAAGATGWLFFPLLLAVTYGWAREIGLTRTWSQLAVLMVATVPTAYHVAASAYVDIALALYVTLAIFALSRWWRTLDSGWLTLIALFLGAGLSTKLTTVFVIAAFALVILLRLRKAQASQPDKLGKIAGLGFVSLIFAGVIASPWYLRTWSETGSPVFPFYMSVWKGEAAGWDVERSNLFQAMNTQYGGYSKSPVDYLAAPWNLSVTAQPEIAMHFDGVLGVAFLMGLPILVWALWKFDMPVEIRIGTGVAAVMFLFWLFSSQQLRYLLPILPVLAIGIAAAFTHVGESMRSFRAVGRLSIVAAAVAALLVPLAWFMQRAPLRVVMGGESREDHLARNIDYYPYYRWLNEDSPTESKVWLINMRRDTYHLGRPYFSDYLFEDWTLRRMLWEARDAADLKAKAGSLGVQYILTRHDFLFDYDRSSLVDDRRPRAENEARLNMARELVLDPARTIRADKKFSLVKLY